MSETGSHLEQAIMMNFINHISFKTPQKNTYHNKELDVKAIV
jgi:hypothetical protein